MPVQTAYAWVGLALTIAASTALPTRAQAPATKTGGRTVWDGVYTAAQAARGERQYDASCRGCHDEGPRRGEAFMRDWQGTDLEKLFSQTRTTMPADAPGSLGDAAYLDIVSYMLQVNAFPAGTTELDGTAIAAVRIEGRNGPEPVPNFALVQVVGCLAERAGEWMLADAGEPVRTKDPEPSAGDELKRSGAASLGTGTFRLLNVYPRPDAYKGHRIEAKGFLIRNPAGNRINATSVQSLAPTCR
jgi:S-disulfanyl-L-cysteine oxidoreductase SoxD